MDKEYIEGVMKEYSKGGFWRDRAWDVTETFLKEKLQQAYEQGAKDREKELLNDESAYAKAMKLMIIDEIKEKEITN